jgi:hypothetical protein
VVVAVVETVVVAVVVAVAAEIDADCLIRIERRTADNR